MNYTTTVDDLEVWINLREIKEAVEDFDNDSRQELIEHLQALQESNPKDIRCDEYATFVDDVEVEVEIHKDDLLEQFGDDIESYLEEGKIIIDAPNLAIQMELEEAIKAVFVKNGLSEDNHVWGI